MYRIVLLLAFSFSLVSLYFTFFHQDKFGYVESDRLLMEFHETKAAAKKLESNTSLLRSRFDTLRNELEQLQKTFSENIGSYTKVEREEMEKKVSQKQGEVDSYYNVMSGKIREEDQKMTKELLAKIDKVVKAYGEEHGYSLIFGATSTGNLVYADKAKNLTDEIIGKLNK